MGSVVYWIKFSYVEEEATEKKQHLNQWQMDNLFSFLELPLDRDLYKPKKISQCDKPPIRVLITDAGTKTARYLMYKICSGDVFGKNQPVILHLVNARGSVNHRATLLDLQECGFPALADSVVSAEPEESYGEVDFVILIALFEELSGHNMYNSFLCQLSKAINIAKNMIKYAKPDAKLVVCSPSTKGTIILLTCIKELGPEIDSSNVSGVVFLDVTIAKNLLAAELKTTTDKIKNIVIWGGTVPDLHNATVCMYPPDDKANLKMVELPVMQVLNNQNWIYSEFVPRIFHRVLGAELVNGGAAVASATAKHLKILFNGSDSDDEIVSMGVIIPPHEPYGLSKNIGFSLPVLVKNGKVTVREDVEFSTLTHLQNLKSMHYIQNNPKMVEIYKFIKYIKEYEESTKMEFIWNQHTYLTEKSIHDTQYLKYIISPRHDEPIKMEKKGIKDLTGKKSITWEQAALSIQKIEQEKTQKSVLRFNIEKDSTA